MQLVFSAGRWHEGDRFAYSYKLVGSAAILSLMLGRAAVSFACPTHLHTYAIHICIHMLYTFACIAESLCLQQSFLSN